MVCKSILTAPKLNTTSRTFRVCIALATRHDSVDSVSTSNLVCIKEVQIRTTFNIAGIIYYTCSVIIDIQITRYKITFNERM